MQGNGTIKLSPAQEEAFRGLKAGLEVGQILRVWGGVGRGKTTVLGKLQQETGAHFVSIGEFVKEVATGHPLALEEALTRALHSKMTNGAVVLFDDAQMIDLGRGCHMYPRAGFLKPVVMALCEQAVQSGAKLVFATTGELPGPAEERSYSFGIGRFTAEDYKVLITNWATGDVSQIDCEKLFRFAPKLNAHQLKAGCKWMERFGKLETEQLIEYFRSQRLASNVDLGEVQEVDLASLKGVDDVVRSLEINVVLPLQNDQLASQYSLRSKRGILLYGPPGTGKTTVGRALAHRLRGKFFLIDGTFISGTNDFYQRVHHVFETAKDNSPSVIFIDDADAIFEDGEERGLYRYLLTMLDGLESESAARVCVMMTAMNVADLPPALVRSGRVELWLEMKLPGLEARSAILKEHIEKLPAELRPAEVEPLVPLTDGFTGADLKRTVEDAKAIFAYQKACGQESESALAYYLQAVEAVRQNKARYEEALAGAKKSKNTPPGFNDFIFSQVLGNANE
jgi:transitional endoplasmic reticulum ATPase